jgi:hypothetical protein
VKIAGNNLEDDEREWTLKVFRVFIFNMKIKSRNKPKYCHREH